MKNINIVVENKRAAVVGSPMIICGNSDYTVTFTFDAEWTQSGARTARFVYVKGGEVQHEDKVFTGNTVAVPVLSDVTFVNVGVFEGDLCTTTPARVNCHPSILCGSGTVPAPTPDVYSQIMALFNELAAQGVGGATEEQAQQIRQNKQDIAELADGTKKAGDASKLEGHAASYFATAQSVEQHMTNLESGANTVGKAKEADNARTFGGQAPDYYGKSSEVTAKDDTRSQDTNISDYAKKLVFVGLKENSAINLPTQSPAVTYSYVFGLMGWTDASGGMAHELAFNNEGVFNRRVYDDNTKTNWVKLTDSDDLVGYLPLSGGKLSRDAVDILRLCNTVSNYNYLLFEGASGSLGGIGFAEAGNLVVLNPTLDEAQPLLSAGNYYNYAFPKIGGELGNGTQDMVANVLGNNGAYIAYSSRGVFRGMLGFAEDNKPVFVTKEWSAAHELHHNGNSAKVHIGTSAPSDTSALWIDTSA